MAEPAIAAAPAPLSEEEEVAIAETLNALLAEVRSSRNEISDVKERINEVKQDLKADIKEVRQEVRREVAASEQRILTQVNQRIDDGIQTVNQRIDDGAKAVNRRIDDLRAYIEASRLLKNNWRAFAVAALATAAVVGTFVLQLMEAVN